MMLTRRAFLSASTAALATAAGAEAPLTSLRPRARADGSASEVPLGNPGAPPLRRPLEDLVADAGLGDGVTLRVLDLATGAVLEERNADRPMMPASTTKSVTALYALAHLGARHRFTTQLIATGPIEAGIVRGDIILSGGGDPTLDTDALAKMAANLAAAGVTGLTGAFRVWTGALPYEAEIEPGQLDHLGYNPSVSGLNLNYNRVHFEWRLSGGAYATSFDARSATLRPAVSLPRMQIIDRTVPVYTSEGPDRWTVARRALGQAGSRWLPVRQPGLYAGEVLRVLAADQGITLPAPQKQTQAPAAGTTPVVTHDSAPLVKILEDMLLYSTNLTAEVVGLAASATQGDLPADLDASAARMVAWLSARHGIDAHFVDHSGLSDANRISAAAMTRLLQVAPPELLRPILKHIAIRENESHPGTVVAKTGTLNFVSALAGYVTTTSGRELAFAIYCADETRRAAAVASGDEVPAGSISWNTRAKLLQNDLIRRWSLIA